ncbi:MAG: 30S ribosomal protein S6 [SAR202 cluster bacterium]|nr:30S ribosomal protein S6 [SAR202 cluster bacterium]
MTVIFSPAASEERVTALLDRLQRIITDHQGAVAKQEQWGLRRLAHPIKHLQEGNYVYTQFQAENVAVGRELGSILRVSDDVLRHLIVELEIRHPKPRVPRRAPVNRPPAAAPVRAPQ